MTDWIRETEIYIYINIAGREHVYHFLQSEYIFITEYCKTL